MKKVSIIILSIAILGVMLFHTAGCKKAGEGAFTLTVTLETGVTGLPDTGEYKHDLEDKVTYNYSTIEGYTGLRVYIDGVQREAEGEILISGNHEIICYATEGTGDHLFTVAKSTGVTGTPAATYYYYDVGDEVEYSFDVEDGYTNLKVRLDGEEIATSGTVTVTGDHQLVASAQPIYDIRGSWSMNEAYEDGAGFSVTLTFSGEIEAGTVTDDLGGIGAYTANGREIDFTLEHTNVTYTYTGLIADEESMSGTCKKIAADGTEKEGNFSAKKDATDSTNSRRRASDKYK